VLSVPVSVMVFTLDEEINLPYCLDSLSWCDDVIVVDSFSSDGTERICRQSGIRFYQHAFEGFGSQRTWALEHVPTRHTWVLILDADERVPLELAHEMAARVSRVGEDVGAFQVRRRFHLWGRWLRWSSLYPTWVVRLVRKDRVRYVDRGHAETQTVVGRIEALDHDLIDANLKGIDAWFERQNRYAEKDAQHELGQTAAYRPLADLLASDPLRRRSALKSLASRLPGRGLLFFLYAYVFRLGFLDGKDGFIFCQMWALRHAMIEIHKHDARRRLAVGRGSVDGAMRGGLNPTARHREERSGPCGYS
jgi:glycosyltransferase involved in cell wall biosynthesis